MEECNDFDALAKLCERLAVLQEVYLPFKKPDNDTKSEHINQDYEREEKSVLLRKYFAESPLNFLRRYHQHIKPKEISCFNDISDNVEIAYYIRKICQQEDLVSRTELDSQYMSHQVKNRRYKALQKMIDDGEYFSEVAMKKRCPNLYDYYIGRFLTNEEKEQKLREHAASHPSNLSEFFMDVIEKKQECEEIEEEIEEEEEVEEDEEEDAKLDVPVLEKAYLAEEFKSRMYQRFLDGLDKNFDYESVDRSTEYDDVAQIDRDAEDDYFDDEEADEQKSCDPKPSHNDSESEDELDVYMRQLESGPKDETCVEKSNCDKT